jgi:ion channel-forming bestrophin family protein
MIVYDRVGWLAMVFRVHGSVVRRVLPRVFTTTLVAVGFMVLQDRFPVFRRSLTVTPFLIVALPLGIILGFRNTSSYDRFWEGRKLWGSAVNGSRSFVRQLASLVRARRSEDEDAVTRFRKVTTYRLIAFVQALRLHLRSQRDHADLDPFLTKEEVSALRDEPSPPAALLHQLGRDVGDAHARGWLDTTHVLLLENSIVGLTDVLGGCERIKNTPTPLSYLIFIHRAVAFYCFLLPFGVFDTIKLATPVVVFFVSYALFSLDAIGDELDDPFRPVPNGLPLSALSRSIEIYARKRLGETDLPPPIKPAKGVLR